MEMLRAPCNEYQNLKISKTTFTNVKQVVNTVFGKCIRRLFELYNNYGGLSTYLSIECFRQCLITVSVMYLQNSKEAIISGEFLIVFFFCEFSSDLLTFQKTTSVSDISD